ncbi:MAG: peptidoglycan DD-metalloendopeptidase family protein [Acidobacteriota bacterium]|nr:peptidoglycan DD-metalloendopeptidase family protein [Acidobacteriota bacterium]MDW3228843.1 peptidoglycan DD-metalloendopeptidase family protein [Acidobacteriota bacterium]MDY0231063.1 peptidoglycan DD-metalloendopeptidase family protein [Candidatus Saccharicenans sp.]
MRSRKRINKKKVLAVLLSLFLLLIIILVLLKNLTWERESRSLENTTLPKEISEAPSVEVEELIIPKGKTIIELLAPYGFSPAMVLEIRESTKNVYDLSRILAGQKLRLLKQGSKFTGIQLDLDVENYLEIDLKSEPPKANLKSRPVNQQLVLIEGLIEDSLIAAINQAGEQDILALNLSEIFAWNIDFYLDLRKGDIFRVLVEKKYISGQFAGYGPILAAVFLNNNQVYEAFRYVFPESGKADYFDRSGNSLRKEFLKSPLRYARITSRFSHSRLHPIRKIYRPHYGVDYAAPIGTPVQATAPGVVTFAGWNGAAGRMVRIRHKNAYETMYLHLKSLPPGIKTGARVEGGQVIGYVGSTGESTGPHLDYRLLYHGKYVNPLAWKFQPADPLPEQYKPDFTRKVKVLQSLILFPIGYI